MKEIKDWNKFRDQFVRETLRRASFRWPPRAMAIKAARTSRQVNKNTGKLCWHVRCANCNIEIIEREARLDHIQPVVPIDNIQSMYSLSQDSSKLGLGQYVLRMFPEAIGFAVLCQPCHSTKTSRESAERAEYRRRQGERGSERRSVKVDVAPPSLDGTKWVSKGTNLRGNKICSEWVANCPKCQGTLYGSSAKASACFVCGGKIGP